MHRIVLIALGLIAMAQPAAAESGWQCLPGIATPVQFANGDVQCAARDGRNCLWGECPSTNAAATPWVAPPKLKPLACGADHKAKYGFDGYSKADHWCHQACTAMGNCPGMIPPAVAGGADNAQCGAWMEQYHLSPYASWGSTPGKVQKIWDASDCNHKVCQYMADKYGVVPGSNWGSLPGNLQQVWSRPQVDCDHHVAVAPSAGPRTAPTVDMSRDDALAFLLVGEGLASLAVDGAHYLPIRVDMLKSLKPERRADVAKGLCDMVKRVANSELFNSLYGQRVEPNEGQPAKKGASAGLRAALNKQLTTLLAQTDGVQYDAPTKVEGDRVYFADEVNENRAPEWKMCFRAGKEVCEEARAFARKWLTELK